MQVVIEKLQAGAQKAQEVARKLETPAPSAEGVEALVSPSYHNLPCLPPTACYMPLPPCSSKVHCTSPDSYSWRDERHLQLCT